MVQSENPPGLAPEEQEQDAEAGRAESQEESDAETRLLDNGKTYDKEQEAGINLGEKEPSSPRAGKPKKKKKQKSEQDRLMTAEINKLLNESPLEKNVTCGFWIFKGAFYQRWVCTQIYKNTWGNYFTRVLK